MAARETALPVSSPPPCSPRILKMEEFFPETYRLDIRDEREAFFNLFDGERPLEARPGLGRRLLGWGVIRAGPGEVRVWSGGGKVEPGGRSQGGGL